MKIPNRIALAGVGVVFLLIGLLFIFVLAPSVRDARGASVDDAVATQLGKLIIANAQCSGQLLMLQEEINKLKQQKSDSGSDSDSPE